MECDIQESFRKLAMNFETLAHNAKRLAKVAKLFNIPVLSTQQLVRVFGKTAKEIQEEYNDAKNCFQHEKTDFSMLEQPVADRLAQLGRKKVILYGIEAHVCVKQTCLDLLDRGFQVVLVVDAISSMSYHDRTVGIEAMRDAGAVITTFQSLVFELSRNPSIPQYKALLQVIKDMPKEHLHLHHNTPGAKL